MPSVLAFALIKFLASIKKEELFKKMKIKFIFGYQLKNDILELSNILYISNECFGQYCKLIMLILLAFPNIINSMSFSIKFISQPTLKRILENYT